MVLAWLFVLVGAAHAATGPAPDPAPTGVQPDAVPGATTMRPAPRPVTRAPVVVQQSQPVQQATPTVPAASADSASAATTTSSTPAKATHHANSKPKPAHKRVRHRRHAAAESGRDRQVSLTAIHPRAAIAAAQHVAAVLTFSERSAKKSALSDGELLAAGILLLLFAAAAASVLRLSTRVASEVPGGRAG